MSTTAALVTPPGRGAVATIQISGPPIAIGRAIDSYFHPRNRRKFINQPIGRILFGDWTSFRSSLSDSNGPLFHSAVLDGPIAHEGAGESVVVCRTSTEISEIHCHGGTVAANRILRHLKEAEITVSRWAELVEGNQGLPEREWAETLSLAKTARAADALLGMRPARLERFVNWLLAYVETGLDKATEPNAEALAAMQGLEQLQSAVANTDFGLRLTQPFRVVLTGRPNVGKSSLLNALLGFDRAIVASIPGTTRDVVTGETAFAGWPCSLMDSAGLRDTSDPVETAGIAAALQNIDHANLVILVLDLSQPLTTGDRELLKSVPHSFIVANKADCRAAWSTPDLLDSSGPERPRMTDGSSPSRGPRLLPVSALTHIGLPELVAAIELRVVPCSPRPEEIFPISPRQANLLAAAANAWKANDWSAAKEFLTEILTG